MTVQVYAVLKDYFEKEFQINEEINSIHELSDLLIKQNPSFKDILPVCRFAVNNEFVDDNYELKKDDSIHIIPPSSGG